MFAVSAGFNQEKVCEEYEKDGDDYSIIMVKTITDRLAEAFAEKLHEDVRTKLWGFASREINNKMDITQMLDVKYQGIRPAPGYPM